MIGLHSKLGSSLTLCAHWAGGASTRNFVAEKIFCRSEGGSAGGFKGGMPSRPSGSVFPFKKVRAKCIITAPQLTLSELTAPRGEYAALRRAKSAFVFAVKSQSSPQ